MIIDLTEIINSKVILVLTIVLLKDRRYLLLSLISVRLRIHRLHEFDETYATCLLHIELRHYLVSGLAIRIETVLSEEEFEVVGEEHAHTGGVIGIEDFLQVNDVLIIERTCDV